MFYQVPHIEKSIPDFKKRNMELLISETNPGVIRTMEEFEVKIITRAHVKHAFHPYFLSVVHAEAEIIKFSVF